MHFNYLAHFLSVKVKKIPLTFSESSLFLHLANFYQVLNLYINQCTVCKYGFLNVKLNVNPKCCG